MARDGVAHKVVSVILRLFELCCAIIVLGILSRFAYEINLAGVDMDGRLIYTMVVAGIAIVYSIFFCPPFDTLFVGFAFDFILFIMWLVAYCLLQSRTAGQSCSAGWYVNYWGYYWGHFWILGPAGTVRINSAGCGEWRTVLAFSFIAWFLHLLSGILGAYVFRTYVMVKDVVHSAKQQMRKMSHSTRVSSAYNRDSANMEATQEGAPQTQQVV